MYRYHKLRSSESRTYPDVVAASKSFSMISAFGRLKSTIGGCAFAAAIAPPCSPKILLAGQEIEIREAVSAVAHVCVSWRSKTLGYDSGV